MFFSPITERSFSIRFFYAALYLVLSLLGLTMVVPLLVMLSGSVEPGNRASGFNVFPTYLMSDKVLWNRYVFAKYRGQYALLQMSWDDPLADIMSPRPPAHAADDLSLWNQFIEHIEVDEFLVSPGFSSAGAEVPSYYNRKFQSYLETRFDSIASLNEILKTNFSSFIRINPPPVSLTGPNLERSPLLNHFLEFSADDIPLRDKFVWNAGAFYRAVFLPQTLGPDIGAYNQKYGTNYSSYHEVPFPSTVPEVGVESWSVFVTQILRPNFIALTEKGKRHLAESQRNFNQFVRSSADPSDLQVRTLDCLFQDWSLEQYGVADARIPAYALDQMAFSKDRGLWRFRLLTQNYLFVLDEILLHGHAMTNTLILVALMVGGALVINPLAAYALSRFRMRQTYFILLFFLSTIAFPSEVTMIPVFLQLKDFHLLNTFGALVLPTLANGFSIFLLKGFFDSLPKELYEAAELDGASEWTMFWLICMNLSKPILAVIGLNAFVVAYSTFFYALILAPDPAMWTIMVYVYQLQQNAGSAVVYTSLIITAVPTLLIFIFCQNIILRGIVVPSEK